MVQGFFLEPASETATEVPSYRTGMDLTDAQGTVLEPILRPQRQADGRGRPWQDTRAVLNGVLWILRTGAPRKDLPDRYPP